MTSSSPLASGPSRRSVVATAAWSVPAVTVATAAPAFAASTDSPQIHLNTLESRALYLRSGIAGLRVTVTSSTGRLLPGMMLTARMPASSAISWPGSVHTVTFGPTDGNGEATVPALVCPVLRDNDYAPFMQLTIDLITTGSQTSPPSITRMLLQQGKRVLATIGDTQTQLVPTVNVAAVGPYYVRTINGDTLGSALHRLGPEGIQALASNLVGDADQGAVVDPVVVDGSTLVTYASANRLRTASHDTSGVVSPIGHTVLPQSDGPVSILEPALGSYLGTLLLQDPSLSPGSRQVTANVFDSASRRTLSGRRTFTWTKTTSGAHYWRAGDTVNLPHVPAKALAVGEDAFLLTEGATALLRGTERLDHPGITSAYAAVEGADSNAASVWFVANGKQLLWRTDGEVEEWSNPSPPPSLDSVEVIPLGYGYYRRGNLHYFKGQEVFWGNASPVVTTDGVSLWGNT